MVRTPTPDPLAHDALAACRLFAGLDERTLDLLTAALRSRRYRRDEVIFHVDDPGDSLFVVVNGSVKITLSADDGTEPAILTTIGRGGFFGELALLDGAPRSATAVAMDAVETLVLRRDAFDRLVDTEPGLRRALAGDPGRRDPAADGPGRGSPLPRSARAARPSPAASDRARRATAPGPARSACRGRSPRASWPA